MNAVFVNALRNMRLKAGIRGEDDETAIVCAYDGTLKAFPQILSFDRTIWTMMDARHGKQTAISGFHYHMSCPRDAPLLYGSV